MTTGGTVIGRQAGDRRFARRSFFFGSQTLRAYGLLAPLFAEMGATAEFEDALEKRAKGSENYGPSLGALQLLEELKFYRVRAIAVSQGVDTEHEQSEVLVTVHGLVDSLYIRELAAKTRRGLEGQKAYLRAIPVGDEELMQAGQRGQRLRRQPDIATLHLGRHRLTSL